MTIKPIKLYYSRSAVVKDWTCPRARYLGYEFAGRGLSTPDTNLNLFLGITIHDAIAALAADADIDSIAQAAVQQVHGQLDVEGDNEAMEFANEQAALVEGMLRGYHRHTWPAFRKEYPTLVASEREFVYEHDGLHFLSKPDLLVRDNDGLLHYVEFKTASYVKDQWVAQWKTAVQLHSSIMAVEAELGEEVASVIVQAFLKGGESYGRQNSIFCYAYRKEAQPPFSKEICCLPPETRVVTEDLRWVAVGTLKVGDKLAAFDENPIISQAGQVSRRWRTSQVKKIGRALQPCMRIHLSDGRVITASKAHKWLTSSHHHGLGIAKWRRTDELLPKDVYKHRASKIVQPLPVFELDTSYEAGYLAGMLDGEGSLVQQTFSTDRNRIGLTFTQNPGPILDHVAKLLNKYGKATTYTSNSKNCLQVHLTNREAILTLLGSCRPKRLLKKLSLDKLGQVRPRNRPVTVIKLEEVGYQEVVTLETSTKTLIAEGLASHNSYEYKAGFKKFPVWDLPGGVKEWVAKMPTNLLSQQFPQVPPIFINRNLVEGFFRQRATREHTIKLNSTMLNDPDLPDEQRQEILDAVFPQYFERCNPGFGFGCEFVKICHGTKTDPLAHGFTLRHSHHDLEEQQLKANETPNNS